MKILNFEVKVNLSVSDIMKADGLCLLLIIILFGISGFAISYFVPMGENFRSICLICTIPFVILLLSVLIISKNISINKTQK